MTHIHRLSAAACFAAGILLTLPGYAAPSADAKDKPAVADKDTAKAPVEEQAQPSRGSVTVNGHSVDYTVTPGTLTLRNREGAPIASMFYVAYTAPGKNRPVTFLFNGGPGSASLWLHMGSFSPIRVDTPTTGNAGPAPFKIHANDASLIDKTDLVFLDAIGTGLSRPIGKAKGKDFYGVDQDIDAFTKAIKRYLTKYNRWNAPKYVLGESYGTLRAAGLSASLYNAGVQLNGVILLSSILNYGIDDPGYDIEYMGYLPSFAATAWYHNKLANKPAELAPFLDKVRAFAIGPYLSALAQGENLPAAQADAIASKMAEYTGLSKAFILRCKLRVSLHRFRKELLRDQGLVVGRYDSRFTATEPDNAGEGPHSDPSDDAINGAYVAAINSYLFGKLKYKTDLEYRLGAYGKDFDWDWKHRVRGYWEMNNADTALDLANAMRENPKLQVLSLNGYYDMATPFFITEYDIAHMQLAPKLRQNIHFLYYKSGHMAYLRDNVRLKLHHDLVQFIADSSR